MTDFMVSEIYWARQRGDVWASPLPLPKIQCESTVVEIEDELQEWEYAYAYASMLSVIPSVTTVWQWIVASLGYVVYMFALEGSETSASRDSVWKPPV